MRAQAITFAAMVLAVSGSALGARGAVDTDHAPAPAEPAFVVRQQDARCTPGTLSLGSAESAAKAGIFDRVRTLPARPPTTLTHAVGPDGTVLQELGRQDRHTESGAVLRPGTLAVFDPRTGRTERIRGKANPGRQTLFADLDRDHVVWTEQPDTAVGEAHWTMYAADRSTGRISTVAKARELPEIGTAPTVPGYTIPTVNDGWVYWPEARSNPVEGKPPVVNVYGRRLGSDRPAKLVVENAISPIATGDALYYIGFEPERWKRQEYAIHRLSIPDGKTSLIDSARGAGRAGFLAAEGETVAWSLGRTILVFRGEQRIARVETGSGALMWLRAGRDTIGFTRAGAPGSTQFLLDLRDGCTLYELEAGKGLGEVHVGDDTVTWTVPNDSDPNDSGRDGNGPGAGGDTITDRRYGTLLR